MNTIDSSETLPWHRRPIGAVAVCARLPQLASPEARSMVWFLQSFGAEPGGLARVARDLVDTFPDRLRTPPPEHRLADARLAEFIEPGTDQPAQSWAPDELRSYVLAELPELLRRFCTSALCYWPGEQDTAREEALEALQTGLGASGEPLKAPWFEDLPGALLEYQRRHAENVGERFYLTNIGRAVWRALDRCLAIGGTVVVGESGRGKSTAAKAWCDAHRGIVRFVTLPGSSDALAVFRSIAEALGIGVAQSQAAARLRERVSDVLRGSGLMLVIDEAHYLVPDKARATNRRPELLNWLDTVLHESGVRVCLIATPQFARGVADLERREGWNALQFRRRFPAWVTLESATSSTDMVSLAERLLPSAGRKAAKLAASYALLHRDVSGLGDLVKASRYLAGVAGRSEPAKEDVIAALGDLEAADTAMETAFNGRRSGTVRAAKQPVFTISGDHFAETAPTQRDDAAETPPRLRVGVAEDFAHVRRDLIPAPATA